MLLKPGNLSAPLKATLRHDDFHVSLQSRASFNDGSGYKAALAHSNHPPRYSCTTEWLPSFHINIQKPVARNDHPLTPPSDTVRATVLEVFPPRIKIPFIPLQYTFMGMQKESAHHT